MHEPIWKIQRTWDIVGEKEHSKALTTTQLAEFDTVVMLGPAGIGKTVEARQLAEYERSEGRHVRWCRLADFAGSTDELRRELESLSSTSTSTTTLILDALDEAMIPLRRSWKTLEHWLGTSVTGTGTRVRITSRPAVWQSSLTTAMVATSRNGRHAVAALRPLTAADVALGAAANGIDGAAFVEEIRRCRAELLAFHPLTLLMLLRVKRTGVELPSSLARLFDLATRALAADQHERFTLATHDPRSVEEILRTAEWVACHTVLTGQHQVSLGEATPAHGIMWTDLSVAGAPALDASREALLSLARSGLCDSPAPGSFEFVHRQFAEYLAARRIARMLPHQARSLLASPAGWTVGVAGPLRETAAFAAMDSQALAEWIAEYDPEVIGLSDVASDPLRKQALSGLLDQFRSGAMTDVQVSRGEMELRGFRYQGAEDDLRGAMAERGNSAADVLQCVIEIVETWPLASMSDDLATLMLDSTAPLHSRVSAGYALVKLGTPESRARLLSLTQGDPLDQQSEVKALAISCNWPDRMSTRELLKCLHGRPSSYHGAFDGLLFQLDDAGFDAADCHLEGLRWAVDNLSETGDSDPAHRIAMRIAHAALGALDDVRVVDALVTLLLDRAEHHKSSPLAALTKRGLGGDASHPKPEPPLATDDSVRRRLIDAVITRAKNPNVVRWFARETPGLSDVRDFAWLLKRSTDTSRPESQRSCYAEVARWTPWTRSLACWVAWWPLRNRHPVSTVLSVYVARSPWEWCRLTVQRTRYAIETTWERWRRRKRRVRPSPSKRVQLRLRQAERQDVRTFEALCQELTLTRYSSHYESPRFVSQTPGWKRAPERLRRRIVSVAKTFLLTQSSYPTTASDRPLNTVSPSGMAAMWLLLERDADWLGARDSSWWATWCWYILRELHPNTYSEPQEPKVSLLKLLWTSAPASARAGIVRMACDLDDAAMLLQATIGLLRDVVDAELDGELVMALTGRRVKPDRIGVVSEFVLMRRHAGAIDAVLSLIADPARGITAGLAVPAAAAMLRVDPKAGWDQVTHLIETHAEVGRAVLSRFAHERHVHVEHDVGVSPLDALSADQIGEIVRYLLELYPPDSDPQHVGAYHVGPDESARDLRDRLISALGDRADSAAVDALQKLERRFSGQYPWLRRPRARAQANHRMSQWSPLPTSVVAEVLTTSEATIIRSADDVLDGVRAALDGYARALRIEGSDSPEDLWNTANQPPSPKSEEHVSGKLCGAIRAYFERFAVATDREVEIRRRTLPASYGGGSGEELDILVQVPARGAASGERIRIPIEVKLASNAEVKTAMVDQLVLRYMQRLGVRHGVYVVAWMAIPDVSQLQPHHRPRWPAIGDARADLATQAQDANVARGVVVAPIVIDASLR